MNILFVILITIVAMIFGALYYSPLMVYKMWSKELGMDPNAEINQKEGNIAMSITLLILLIEVCILAFTKVNFKLSTTDFIIYGLILGLVPTYRQILNTKFFEGKSTKLVMISIVYSTIELLIVVLGVAFLIK